MRLIDVDALNLDYEVEMADDWKTAHEIANCVKYAPTVEAVPLDKLCAWLGENADCPPYHSPLQDNCYEKTCATCWKMVILEGMKEYGENK